jgi:hypothetical protein
MILVSDTEAADTTTVVGQVKMVLNNSVEFGQFLFFLLLPSSSPLILVLPSPSLCLPSLSLSQENSKFLKKHRMSPPMKVTSTTRATTLWSSLFPLLFIPSNLFLCCCLVQTIVPPPPPLSLLLLFLGPLNFFSFPKTCTMTMSLWLFQAKKRKAKRLRLTESSSERRTLISWS